MNTKRFFAQISFMRKPTVEYEYLKNIDEKEVYVKDLIKKEIKNENN